MSTAPREPIRVLLIKPCQPANMPVPSPPLGILMLASCLRARLGDQVSVRTIDCALGQRRYTDLADDLESFDPHVVGMSALNIEAVEAGRIADMVKARAPETVTVLGGPFAHGEANIQKAAATGVYDWIFDGEADLSFPIAVDRWFNGPREFDDIVGLTWRHGERYVTNGACGEALEPMVGKVGNLDDLPFPAWDLVDFDAYARRINNNGNLRGTRYAPIFTSRGCPYKCTYCHDIFGKSFYYRTPENVLEEIRLLKHQYGVDELQIVDDIFNLRPARMKEICRGLAPLKMHICFPNGLRGDILDEEGVQALVDAGMYEVAVAIETVTPRLQDMVKKRLKLDRLVQNVKWMADRGVMVKGFFMLGFPTETVEEMQATIDFAVDSELAHVVFACVTPQPATPLYEVAYRENAQALHKIVLGDYYSTTSWYSEAYGIDLRPIYTRAYFRFYATRPKRIWRLMRYMSAKDFVRDFFYWCKKVFVPSRHVNERLNEALPASLEPLRCIAPVADTPQ
jgi:radical SAM superfamily enzyme YgiQ (UPF0313 family)